MALESREGTRASRRVEEGLSRSLSGGGGKPSCPSPSAGDLRELPRVPLRGEASCGVGGASRDSALLPSREPDLLEPTEWPQGSQASSSVWREDSAFLSRAGRKRRPSSPEDGGVSGVSSSRDAHGGLLTRHDEGLREPCVRCQGSRVSMRVVRGSASWLSSHGKGLGPRDVLKKDSRVRSRGAAGNPRFPRPLPGT